jgi:hypothetical protein
MIDLRDGEELTVEGIYERCPPPARALVSGWESER